MVLMIQLLIVGGDRVFVVVVSAMSFIFNFNKCSVVSFVKCFRSRNIILSALDWDK